MVPELILFQLTKCEPRWWNPGLRRFHHSAADDEYIYVLASNNIAECGGIGTGHPYLCAQRRQCIVKSQTACRIEMRNNLIEQQQWRKARHLLDQIRVRKNEADQQRLLLSG